MRITQVLALILFLAFLGSESWAQESAPTSRAAEPAKGLQADPATVAVLDKMDASLYDLARGGLKKVSFKAKYDISSMIAPEPIAGTFDYVWDTNFKGKLSLHNPGHRPLLAQGGIQDKMLERLFDRPHWREKFADCQLSLKKEEGKTIIDIAGKNALGVQTLVLNEQGVPATVVMELPQMPGTQGTMSFEYTEHDGKYSPKSMIFNADMPGMGKIHVSLSYEYTQVGSYHVVDKYTYKVKMDDQEMGGSSLAMSHYKFNDDVMVPEPAAPKKEAGGW